MRAFGPRLGLGVGLDLPFRGPYGITGDRVADRTLRFLQRHAHRFAYLFVSWQPADKATPSPAGVQPAWDALFADVPIAARAVHQTALNLAGVAYDRGPVVRCTNALIARYGFRWVNEDLGSWSVHGRPMPYPQPPPLTDDGVAHCMAACAEVDRALDAPLVVEFPGFETPVPWVHGTLDAYDVFRRIVVGADVACNLDTGHLLTWRWRQGHRGAALLDGLDRLPLDRCVEIHCAGVQQTEDRMIDAHHGVLLDVQLELARRLMEACPNLRVVTYEDPRFDDEGRLPPRAAAGLDALEQAVGAWMATPDRAGPVGACTTPPPPVPVDTPWEDELEAVVASATPFGRRCRRQVLTRSTRGVGTLTSLFPVALAAWRDAHPDDPDLDGLVAAFLSSDDGRAWSAFAWAVPGRCLEDAFGRFLAPGSHEHVLACARVLATHPDPPFRVPEAFTAVPRGWFALLDGPLPTLVAVLDGQLVTGPITPLLARLLAGERPAGCGPAVAELAARGLVEPMST